MPVTVVSAPVTPVVSVPPVRRVSPVPVEAFLPVFTEVLTEPVVEESAPFTTTFAPVPTLTTFVLPEATFVTVEVLSLSFVTCTVVVPTESTVVSTVNIFPELSVTVCVFVVPKAWAASIDPEPAAGAAVVVRAVETPVASKLLGREEPAVVEAPPILAVSSTLPAELPDKATTAEDPAAIPVAPVEPNISLHAELNTPFNISAP